MPAPTTLTAIETLLKWGPEAVSVSAVIVTVILFLRRDAVYAARIEKMGDRCHAQQTEAQKGFMTSLRMVLEADEKRMALILERLNRLDGSVEKLAQAVNRLSAIK